MLSLASLVNSPAETSFSDFFKSCQETGNIHSIFSITLLQFYFDASISRLFTVPKRRRHTFYQSILLPVRSTGSATGDAASSSRSRKCRCCAVSRDNSRRRIVRPVRLRPPTAVARERRAPAPRHVRHRSGAPCPAKKKANRPGTVTAQNSIPSPTPALTRRDDPRNPPCPTGRDGLCLSGSSHVHATL